MKLRKPCFDKENLKEALAKKNVEDVKKCEAEIQASLEKFDCLLDVAVVVRVNGNFPQVNILHK